MPHSAIASCVIVYGSLPCGSERLSTLIIRTLFRKAHSESTGTLTENYMLASLVSAAYGA